MLAIVTDVHYRMSPALVRDLGQAGVTVVTCEKASCKDNPAAPALGALSRYAARHVWLPDGEYGDALLSLCRETATWEGSRPALLPVGTSTLALIAQHREMFDGACGLCVPTAAQLELFNSKDRVSTLAASLHIPTPESFTPRPGEKDGEFIARLPLPVIIKPVCGEKLGLTAKDRYRIAGTKEEAAEGFAHFKALAGENPVVQRRLTGDGLGCSVLAWEGEVMAHICHRRLREYPVSGGPSTCCQVIDAPELAEYARRLVRETGYTGLAMFEFKEDEAGRPHLLEINPRVWGTFPLTRVSGSGIPLLWCALSYRQGNPEADVPLPAVPPLRYRKMIFVCSDLLAAVGYIRGGRPGKGLRAALDLLNPIVPDGVFSWGDPAPGFAYLRSLFHRS